MSYIIIQFWFFLLKNFRLKNQMFYTYLYIVKSYILIDFFGKKILNLIFIRCVGLRLENEVLNSTPSDLRPSIIFMDRNESDFE